MKKLVFLISLLTLAIATKAEQKVERIFILKVGKTMTMYYDGTDSALLKSNPNDTIFFGEESLLENFLSAMRFSTETLSDGLWEATIDYSGNNLWDRNIYLRLIPGVPHYKTLNNDGSITTRGNHYKISDCYKDLYEENENLKNKLITIQIIAFCSVILLFFLVIWVLRKNRKK